MEAAAADPHHEKVARIARQLRAHPGGQPVSLRKKAVSHQVPKARDLRRRDAKIDVSDLTEILSIDPVRRICVAESGVTFVDLVTATLAHGLAPIVVPELKTITIGGAVAGCSIESMSYVHGGFHDTCLEYEVITATGEVLVCTPDNAHQLVFQMMQGAFGTLGILAKLTFKLIPAGPYVKLRYAIQRHFEARDVDFMDGIIHSSTCYVLATGDFVDAAPYTSDYHWMKIYYQSTRTRTEDYLTTPDYFFRYDRGVTNVRPASFAGRLVFGRWLASSQWLRLGEKLRWLLRSEKPTVTLDVFIPFSRVPEFLTWYDREFGFYPLWCVPYRRVRDYEWLDDSFYRGMTDTLFLDLAVYGMRQRGPRNAYRVIEEKLREVGGVKTLIAHNYYSEAEFWAIWNKRNYDAVKAITDPANVFRDLYTKTCRAVMGHP
jgi:FAD/FMN-containing dehydrogenase